MFLLHEMFWLLDHIQKQPIAHCRYLYPYQLHQLHEALLKQIDQIGSHLRPGVDLILDVFWLNAIMVRTIKIPVRMILE